MFDPRALARLKKSRNARIGAVIVLFLVLFALLFPLVAQHSPLESDFVRGVDPDNAPVGPNRTFWLGADRLYRDVLVRLAYGGRVSLIIGLVATGIASALGATVGIVAGFYESTGGLRVPWLTIVLSALCVVFFVFGHGHAALGALAAATFIFVVSRFIERGWFSKGPAVNADTILMRAVDVGLSFPFLLLVMGIGAALDQTSMGTILLTLGFTGWLGTARVLRAKTMQTRKHVFVEAARALGQSTPRILFSHILPNVSGPLIVIATGSVAQMIIAESVLSYLNVGLSPPTPSWGKMLFDGQDVYQAAPWLVAAPGGAILLAVFGFNLLGEGLRDALDPKE